MFFKLKYPHNIEINVKLRIKKKMYSWSSSKQN